MIFAPFGFGKNNTVQYVQILSICVNNSKIYAYVQPAKMPNVAEILRKGAFNLIMLFNYYKYELLDDFALGCMCQVA